MAAGDLSHHILFDASVTTFVKMAPNSGSTPETQPWGCNHQVGMSLGCPLTCSLSHQALIPGDRASAWPHLSPSPALSPCSPSAQPTACTGPSSSSIWTTSHLPTWSSCLPVTFHLRLSLPHLKPSMAPYCPWDNFPDLQANIRYPAPLVQAQPLPSTSSNTLLQPDQPDYLICVFSHLWASLYVISS